jgi:hypothetical protein
MNNTQTNTYWQKINEFYSVSNSGKVYSHLTKKELKPWLTGKGYLKIDMGRNKRVYVHRLVAETFLPNPDNKPTVNHKDHDKTNNSLSNLEWATYKEQISHDITTGKRIIKKGKDGRFQKCK